MNRKIYWPYQRFRPLEIYNQMIFPIHFDAGVHMCTVFIAECQSYNCRFHKPSGLFSPYATLYLHLFWNNIITCVIYPPGDIIFFIPVTRRILKPLWFSKPFTLLEWLERNKFSDCSKASCIHRNIGSGRFLQSTNLINF